MMYVNSLIFIFISFILALFGLWFSSYAFIITKARRRRVWGYNIVLNVWIIILLIIMVLS